jgi:phytoene synthase
MGLINNKEIIYKNSKSFFWASKFLSSDILKKVVNIYTFCRLHDDLVDEGVSLGTAKEIEELKKTIKKYGVKEKIINQLLDGIKSDINFKRYKSNEDLLRYCHKVAGIVGIMMVQTIRIKEKEASYFALDLGIAMQLTNISRDVLEDCKKRRIYLPENTNIYLETIDNLSSDNKIKIREVVLQILKIADIYYSSSINGIRYIPLRSRFAILVALRIYQAIGVKIKKTGTKFLDENIFISRAEKILIIFKTIIEFIIFFILPLRKKRHNACLHKNLKGLENIHE